MIKERIEAMINLPDVSKLMVFDLHCFSRVFEYKEILTEHGFKIVHYMNVEAFRLVYEESLKTSAERIAVIVDCEIYLPYDIQQKFRKVDVSLTAIFPKLHSEILAKYARDVDLISFAYEKCYASMRTPAETEGFIQATALSEATIIQYCTKKTALLKNLCESASRYTDWIVVAKLKALIQYYSVSVNLTMDLSFANEAFMRFIENGYARLSSELGMVAPAIITKMLGFICNTGNPKVALIVMDGMSLFDFEVISRHFDGIEYSLNASFALIPTTTPISRQSLLSGKYPRELEKPFSLANEEKEFIVAGVSLGYANNQIQYLRGYEPNISHFTKLATVIINDVDEIVHGQRQGRVGMFNDMQVLGKSRNLQKLISTLVKLGFEVYITSDHGNTPCVGVGGFRSGVEIQSKSMRMAVLKDFADKHSLLDQYATEYPGHYLDKNFNYFVCEPGVSFDNKGESVMTHGGMTIDEVIVPFIKIKEVK